MSLPLPSPEGPVVVTRERRLEDLPVRELQKLLREAGLSDRPPRPPLKDADCLEKSELITRLRVAESGDAACGAAAQEPPAQTKPSVAVEWLGYSPVVASADSGDFEVSTAVSSAEQREGPAEEVVAAPGSVVPTGRAPDYGLDWQAVGRLLARRQRLDGVVKLYNRDKGFGFLASEEVKAIFNRDTYISGHDAEEAELSLGDKVSFTLALDREGRPHARALKVEEAGPIPLGDRLSTRNGFNADQGTAYIGTIKSFNAETGYGFIKCDETFATFSNDVFLHHSQCLGLGVGENVQFRIDVDLKGKPKAKDVERYPPGSDPPQKNVTELAPPPLRLTEGGKATTSLPPPKLVGTGEDSDGSRSQSSQGLCRYYILKGACVLGEQCRYRHTETESEAAARDQLRDICPFFLGGDCWHVECSKRHPPGAETEVLRKVALTIPCMFGRSCRTHNCIYSHPDGFNPLALETLKQLDPLHRVGRLPQRQQQLSRVPIGALPPRPTRPVPGSEEAAQLAADEVEETVMVEVFSSQQLCDWSGPTFKVAKAEQALPVEPQLVKSEPQLVSSEASPQEQEPNSEIAASVATAEPQGIAAVPSGTPGTGGSHIWERYSTEDGQGTWWWHEVDKDWFMEANPGPWEKFLDPNTGRHYWWKDESTWFWV